MIAVGTDLLVEDLIRSCAPEARSVVAERLRGGEKDGDVRAWLSNAALRMAESTFADASGSVEVATSAVAASTHPEPAFVLGACFASRRLRQLEGSPLNVALWIGKYDVEKPGPQLSVHPTQPRCVALSVSTPRLSDKGNTWRFEVIVRNTCATDQLVMAMRYGSPADYSATIIRVNDRVLSDLQPEYVHDVRGEPVEPSWPAWQGDVPSNLGFVPVQPLRAAPTLMKARQGVRIPYVLGVNELEADFGWIKVFAASCRAFSPEGDYQFMFRGPFTFNGEPLAMACVPNVRAGKR